MPGLVWWMWGVLKPGRAFSVPCVQSLGGGDVFTMCSLHSLSPDPCLVPRMVSERELQGEVLNLTPSAPTPRSSLA